MIEKTSKAYLTYSVLTKLFDHDIKKLSAYFTLNHSHETSKYLLQSLL